MATPLRSLSSARSMDPARLGPRARAVALLLVAGLSFFGLTAAVVAVPAVGVASAAPAPTPERIAAQVHLLQAQVEQLVESYNESTVALAAATERSAALEQAVSVQESRTEALRRELGQLAAAAYRSGSAGTVASLLGTDTPEQFLDQASSLEAVAHERQVHIAEFRDATVGLAAAHRDAAAEVVQRRHIQDRIAKRRGSIERSLRQQQQLLSRLTARGRASVLGTRGVAMPLWSIPAAGRAATAIRFAYAQIGKPYRWGAAGPGSYDCSGLTMRAWGAAGVGMPQSSRAQYASGRRISTSRMQPGDLVFFGSPIHHVGLYIGGGNMIDAPHTGDVVKIRPVLSTGLVGAVRPG